jgi:hypothetical protein
MEWLPLVAEKWRVWRSGGRADDEVGVHDFFFGSRPRYLVYVVHPCLALMLVWGFVLLVFMMR